jgi:hypothetical protein
MAIYKIHRYIVKDADKEFASRDHSDVNEYTESDREVVNKYIEFVKSLPGYYANVVVQQIDDNTVKHTYMCKAIDGKERSTAELFCKELGTSQNPARKNFLLLTKQKGQQANVHLSRNEIEYANGHIETIQKLIVKEEFTRLANSVIVIS